MIKLTLTPDTQPISYIFEKSSIVIGRNHDHHPVPDFILSDDQIEANHIKISWNGSHFIVTNCAQDPFSTLNGIPFSKKQLHNHDKLQIGTTLMQFEGQAPSTEMEEEEPSTFQNLGSHSHQGVIIIREADSSPESEEPAENLHPVIPLDSNEPFVLVEEEEEERIVHPLAQKPMEEEPISSFDELDDLLARVDNLEIPLPSKAFAPSQDAIDESEILFRPLQEKILSKEESQPFFMRRSIKDEPEEVEEKNERDPKKEDKETPISWKVFISSLGSFAALVSIVLACVYLAITDHNQEEEIKAAQAISDIAMALNYAQIHHTPPDNQNWTDPDFIKHNLRAVLAPTMSPLANIDAHGHFHDASYILRIYTSNDLEHYLVIAQPNAGLLQWLMPKAAIIIDSSVMELRKITDLKTLNRLLISATLDNSNSKDILNLVSLGEFIPLLDLHQHYPMRGFLLPKELAALRPGAENYIYNAIRYYPLGESLMQKAITLYDHDDSSVDLLSFLDEIKRFSAYSNIVLYSSEGLQTAQKGYKAFATFSPNHSFLLGFLAPGKKKTYHAKLLLEEHINEFNDLMALEFSPAEEAMASDMMAELANSNGVNPPLAIAEEEIQIEYLKDDLSSDSLFRHSMEEINQTHPLYYKLVALHHMQDQTLQLINDSISNEDDPRKIALLQAEYNATEAKLQQKIFKAISNLQKEYATIPFTQFMNYARVAGVERFIRKNLSQQNAAENPAFRETLNRHIDSIHQTSSLSDLNMTLEEALKLLNLEYFPNPRAFIAYQNRIHSATVHKLDTLILTGDLPLSEDELTAEGRERLSHILKTAWVVDESEFEYYLEEFDAQMI